MASTVALFECITPWQPHWLAADAFVCISRIWIFPHPFRCRFPCASMRFFPAIHKTYAHDGAINPYIYCVHIHNHTHTYTYMICEHSFLNFDWFIAASNHKPHICVSICVIRFPHIRVYGLKYVHRVYMSVCVCGLRVYMRSIVNK